MIWYLFSTSINLKFQNYAHGAMQVSASFAVSPLLLWDPFTGLAVIPNFYAETIAVDSSPALWGSRRGSKEQTIILLVHNLHLKLVLAIIMSMFAPVLGYP